MRLIETDDAAARQSYIYLGPADTPFPVSARLSSQVAGLALSIFLSFVVYVATPFIDLVGLPGIVAWAAHAAIATVAGVAGGVLITRKLAKRVTPYMPWSHHFATMQAEIAVPRPNTDTVEAVLTVPSNLWIEERPESRQVRVARVPHFVDDVDENPTH